MITVKRILWALMLLSLVACSPANPVINDVSVDQGAAPGSPADEPAEPTTLRLAVSLTPQELETFQAAITELDASHPEWNIELELTPQQGVVEKISTQLAAGNLPDVTRVAGLFAQQWIRQDAFLDLTPLVQEESIDESFYPGPLAQFRWQDRLYGIPDTAAPDVVFYNKDMFDAAGLDYPTDEWTHDDMRQAALLLTLDENGRNATDPDFDHATIRQWGWNGGLTSFWQRHLVRGFGGDFCANPDCTLMNFTDPDTIAAAQWWADFTAKDHATLYDPYGGSQTGVPGDPFLAGKAAIGYNGFFAVAQLNNTGGINYDITQPFLGRDGNRYTPVSTNGYVIAADTDHPEAAWALVQSLAEPEFLAATWGAPGHAVPARRSAADAVINLDRPPANQSAIVAAMEYGDVYKPYTTSAFEVYGKTAPLFADMMKGELPVAEAMAEIEAIANDTLASEREE